MWQSAPTQSRSVETPLVAVQSFHLVALGGCNTSGLDQGGCMPAALAAQAATDDIDVRLRNFGAAMLTSREGLAQLRDYHGPLDGLIVNFGVVDAWVTGLPQWYVPRYPQRPWLRAWLRVSKSLKRRLKTPWLRRLVPSGSVVSPVEFEDNLRRIVARGRQLNSEVRIVLWGSCLRNDPARDSLIEDYNRILERVALACDVEYLDTEFLLQPYARSTRFVDGVHFSEFSQQQIASGIGPVLFG